MADTALTAGLRVEKSSLVAVEAMGSVGGAPCTKNHDTENERRAFDLGIANAIGVLGVEGWRVQATAFLVDGRVEGVESVRSGTLKIATSVTR